MPSALSVLMYCSLLGRCIQFYHLRVDAFVQRMLRTKFADTTLITVAHRLNTIMDYEIMLCMDAGKAAEIGSPSELLSRNGLFAQLVDATGSESARALREIASGAKKLQD